VNRSQDAADVRTLLLHRIAPTKGGAAIRSARPMCAPAPWMRSFRWFGQVVDRAARPRAVCCESKNVRSDVAKRCHPRFRRARREMCWGSAIQALRCCISMSRILDIPTSSSCARCRRCGALPVAQYPSNGRLARPRIRPNLWNAARSQAV
jgi:hypothetical protein